MLWSGSSRWVSHGRSERSGPGGEVVVQMVQALLRDLESVGVIVVQHSVSTVDVLDSGDCSLQLAVEDDLVPGLHGTSIDVLQKEVSAELWVLDAGVRESCSTDEVVELPSDLGGLGVGFVQISSELVSEQSLSEIDSVLVGDASEVVPQLPVFLGFRNPEEVFAGFEATEVQSADRVLGGVGVVLLHHRTLEELEQIRLVYVPGDPVKPSLVRSVYLVRSLKLVETKLRLSSASQQSVDLADQQAVVG